MSSLLLVSVWWWPAAVTFAQTLAADEAERAVLLAQIKQLQEQLLALQAILDGQSRPTPVSDRFSEIFAGDEELAVVYTVTGAAVPAIADREHREYFTRLFAVFPPEYWAKLQELAVFYSDDVDAFVETLPPDHEAWRYAINEAVVADEQSDFASELMVHELAHIISLETIVGVPRPAMASCHSYFEDLGCPAVSSYLHQFVEQFWSDSALDRAEQFVTAEDGLDQSYEYYLDNTDAYVTDYAAFNPDEDFAESFVFFVFGWSGEGSLANEKIAFFADYPALQAVKADITAAL